MPPKLPKSLQTLLAKLKQAIVDIFDRYEEGELTAVKWRDAMKAILTRFITASFMSGQESPLIGVTEQGYIYEYIKAQLGFIDNFYLNIVSSPEFQKGWRQRAESYANSIVAPFWKGETKMVALPAMPGDMTTPCGQLCACLWDVQAIDEEKGDYDAYWRLNASREIETEHCQICEQRAVEWNPLKIRDNQLIIPQGEAGKEFVEHISIALKHLPGQHDQSTHGNRFGPRQGKNTGELARNKRLENKANRITKDLESRGITGVRIIVDRQHFEQYSKEKSIDTPAAYNKDDETIRINPVAQHWRNEKHSSEFQNKNRYWSSSNPDHPIIHEVGHKLHYDNIGNRSKFDGLSFDRQQYRIARQVSHYATEDPRNFVAETFSGLYSGKFYGNDVMNLYVSFGGVIP